MKATSLMKAVRMHSRGGPEGLVYEDAPIPELSDGRALVKVHAAGMTPTEFTWSSTFTTPDGRDRLPIIPSFEVAGTVEQLAPGVTDLSLGDAAYGLLNFWEDGAAAEYVAARASDLAPKPKTLDFLSAAAVPLSGLTAWQGLFDYGKLSRGGKVLIHGAGGGVGTFAVQLARWKDAHVVATCSQQKAAFVRGLGADQVIDYARAHFEDEVSGMDLVLDTVGGDTLERSWGVLQKGGTLVTIVGDAPEDKALEHGVHGFSILVKPDRLELMELSRLIDEGKLRPVVDAVFPFSSAREAYERGMRGHSRGKTVLNVID